MNKIVTMSSEYIRVNLHKNIIYTVRKKIKEIIKKSDRRDVGCCCVGCRLSVCRSSVDCDVRVPCAET